MKWKSVFSHFFNVKKERNMLQVLRAKRNLGEWTLGSNHEVGCRDGSRFKICLSSYHNFLYLPDILTRTLTNTFEIRSHLQHEFACLSDMIYFIIIYARKHYNYSKNVFPGKRCWYVYFILVRSTIFTYWIGIKLYV